MNSRQFTILLLLTLIWGASFLFIKVLSNHGFGPTGISGGRSLLGAICIAPLMIRSRREIPRDWQTWGILIGLGLFNFALPWSIFAASAKHAPTGASSIANASQPLWTAVFATLLLKTDRLNGLRVLGLISGFSGVLVLMGGGLLHLNSEGSRAIITMVAACALYSISSIIIRARLAHVSPTFIAGAQMTTAAAALLPIALATGAYTHVETAPSAWTSLLLLGFLGSGVGVVAFMGLITQIGPVRASVVTYMMPPLGIFLGWLLLDESIGLNMIGGVAFVILGVALVQGVPFRRILNFARRTQPAAA